MTPNPENPASAPEKSTLLISRLRTTLDTQWQKFDSSLPSLKGLDSKYNAMKSGYEGLKSDLSRITDDEALKQNTSIQAKLDDFLVKIAKHLTDTTRDKQYDGILTETQSQVASLSSEIYGKKSESGSETLPNPALLAAGGAGAAALASGSALDINQVAEGAQKSVQEATKGFRGWVAEKVKEPGMMGDIFRDLEKKATSWIKDLTTPPTGSWIDSPWEHMKFQMKKWFAPLLAGWFGINLDGMKPSDVKPPQSPGGKPDGKTERAVEKAKNNPYLKYTAASKVYESVMIDKNNLPVANILQHVGEGSLASYTLKDLRAIHQSKDYDKIISRLPKSFKNPENKEALSMILASLFDTNKSRYMQEAYLSGTGKSIKSPLPDSLTLKEYFEGSYAVIRRMNAVGKAMITQGSAVSSRMSVRGNTVEFTDEVEESETMKLLDGDKKLLTFAFVNASFKYKKGDASAIENLKQNTQFMALYPEDVEKEKALGTMKKFFDFVEKFYRALETNKNIHLGMGNKIKEILDKRPLNIRGLMMAYLSFGEKGIENFDNFSTIEQTEVYSYVMSIFASEDKQFDQGKLTSEYLTKLEKSSDPIPQNVMNFMKEVLGYAAENTWTAVWKGLQFFAGVAVDNPRLAAILGAMNIPIIPDRSSMADIVFF